MPRKPKDADKLYGFGDRIRRLRKRAGLSQAELANEIGATKQSISWWEQDVARNQRYECSNCSAIALYRVSKVLDTTMEYLIAGEGRSLTKADEIATAWSEHDEIEWERNNA